MKYLMAYFKFIKVMFVYFIANKNGTKEEIIKFNKMDECEQKAYLQWVFETNV